MKKQLREKEMMSLTVRSINTPATTVAAGKKPKTYDIFARGSPAAFLNSDSGSY